VDQGASHCATPGCTAPKMLVQGNGNCAKCNKRIKNMQRRINKLDIKYTTTSDNVTGK